mmetsp:Transcript_19837/g.43353  ORF Transcript_19837/g.43353 Transcript_19837/m.43353 type:complete len:810 (-) Transcript_19837:44-2473(-)
MQLQQRRSSAAGVVLGSRHKSVHRSGAGAKRQGAYFFEYLDRSRQTEWVKAYVDHSSLRRYLLRCQRAAAGVPVSGRSEDSAWELEEVPVDNGPCDWEADDSIYLPDLDLSYTVAKTLQESSLISPRDTTKDRPRWETWCEKLRSEVEKVDRHFHEVTQAMEMKLSLVQERAPRIADDQCEAETRAARLLLLEKDLSGVYARIKQLREYASHNFSLCLRLTDDFIAVGGPPEKAKELSRWVKDRPFHSTSQLSKLQECIEDLEESLGVDAIGHRLCFESQTRQESSLHSSLLGAMVVCWIFIGLFTWKTATNPNFSRTAYAGALPVFRCSFMLGLMLWMAGCVVLTFERYRVNYLMIMSVDPAVDLQSSSIFALAQVQTLIFTVLFLTYLMDFKFGLLFNTDAAYELYPLVQAVLSASLWILPVNVFPWMGLCRARLWSCLMSVFFAFHPVGQVTFASNLLGDVLTSFAKPLKDVIYTGCYLTTVVGGQFTLKQTVEQCKPLRGYTATFLILDLPLVFRLVQCLRRYKDTGQRFPHLANVGKYLTSLLVSVVAFVNWEQNWGWSAETAWHTLLFSYLTATVYSLVWDLYMDWGLLPDFPRSRKLLRVNMMYPPWVYRVLAVADVLGRSTWAANLMPNGALFSGKVEREIFQLTISAIEVVRRAFWTVLRVEHEQLTNVSKYRDVLWLPPLRTTTAPAGRSPGLVGGVDSTESGTDTVEEIGANGDLDAAGGRSRRRSYSNCSPLRLPEAAPRSSPLRVPEAAPRASPLRQPEDMLLRDCGRGGSGAATTTTMSPESSCTASVRQRPGHG